MTFLMLGTSLIFIVICFLSLFLSLFGVICLNFLVFETQFLFCMVVLGNTFLSNEWKYFLRQLY